MFWMPCPSVKRKELRRPVWRGGRNLTINPKPSAQSLVELLTNFADELRKTDLRAKVLALIPAVHKLRDLGSSLMPKNSGTSALERIIAYLKNYPKTVIAGDEIMVVSGIGEWARRVRQLRVQFGWWIYSGVTFKQIAEDEQKDATILKELLGVDPVRIRPDQYVLMRVEQDLEAAHRWNTLNQIRKSKVSVTDKILEYFRKNVGKQITGEELKYLAKDKSEWARRSRELRTEQGWPVVTKSSGREDLPVGVYVLEKIDKPTNTTGQFRTPFASRFWNEMVLSASSAAGAAPCCRQTTHVKCSNFITSNTIRTRERIPSRTSLPCQRAS